MVLAMIKKGKIRNKMVESNHHEVKFIVVVSVKQKYLFLMLQYYHIIYCSKNKFQDSTNTHTQINTLWTIYKVLVSMKKIKPQPTFC